MLSVNSSYLVRNAGIFFSFPTCLDLFPWDKCYLHRASKYIPPLCHSHSPLSYRCLSYLTHLAVITSQCVIRSNISSVARISPSQHSTNYITLKVKSKIHRMSQTGYSLLSILTLNLFSYSFPQTIPKLALNNLSLSLYKSLNSPELLHILCLHLQALSLIFLHVKRFYPSLEVSAEVSCQWASHLAQLFFPPVSVAEIFVFIKLQHSFSKVRITSDFNLSWLITLKD